MFGSKKDGNKYDADDDDEKDDEDDVHTDVNEDDEEVGKLDLHQVALLFTLLMAAPTFFILRTKTFHYKDLFAKDCNVKHFIPGRKQWCRPRRCSGPEFPL